MESAWSYQYPAHREGEGGDPRKAAEEHPRHRLQGTDQGVYWVSLHGSQRQEAHRYHRRNRAGTRRLHLSRWSGDANSDDDLR